jgi:hypothetical protein
MFVGSSWTKTSVLLFQLTLPPWSMFRKNPLNWQKARKEAEEVGSSSTPQSEKKTKKKK